MIKPTQTHILYVQILVLNVFLLSSQNVLFHHLFLQLVTSLPCLKIKLVKTTNKQKTPGL